MLPNNSDSQVAGSVDLFSRALPDWFDLLGLMAWPLAICALLVLTISLERLVFFIKLSLRWNHHYDNVAMHIERLKTHPKSLRDEVASQIVQEIQKSYFNGISLLRTVSVISPLLGLLGTILGIITSFKVIAVQTGPVSPNMIADGLWEAMLTTATGLLIALPAIMAAYVYKYLADLTLHRICLKLNRQSMSYELEKYENTP